MAARTSGIGPITREAMERVANQVRKQGPIRHRHVPGTPHADICNRCGGWQADHEGASR